MTYNPEQTPGLNRPELGPINDRVFELRQAWLVADEYEKENQQSEPKPVVSTVHNLLFGSKTPQLQPASLVKPTTQIESARNQVSRIIEEESAA